MNSHDFEFEEYVKAIKLNPDTAVDYSYRGLAYYNHEKYEQALADYNYAIKLEPMNVVLYLHRGRIHVKRGNADEARSDFKKAKRLGNDDAQEELDRLK